jgi:hypothetical protein
LAKRKDNSETPGTTAANVGYEAQLWQMADALRGACRGLRSSSADDCHDQPTASGRQPGDRGREGARGNGQLDFAGG